MNLNQKVLIVDGEHVIADTLAQIFSDKGFEVKAVYDAETAIALAKDWQPDLGIFEIILREMNGFDCAVHLRTRYPDCRIILLYAVVADFILEDARDLNFEVFAKPVDPQILLAIAAKLLDAGN